MGYDKYHGTHVYQTVSGVVAYKDPTTGRTLHLVINQAIHIPLLDHHLLCPMQCRVNDVTVNETPKFLVTRPTDHTLTNPEDPVLPVILPLELRGLISLLYVRNTNTPMTFTVSDIPTFT